MYAFTTLLFFSLGVTQTTWAEEHIVDDQHGSPGFTTTGDDWTTWGTNGHGYSGSDSSYHYLSHTVGGSDRRGTATWRANLGQTGIWRIETWFRRTENRTHDANHILTDGYGQETHIVIDQEGEGASGWMVLGEIWCEAGFGTCKVTLDGPDDDDSDAANAMRFTFVSSEGGSTEGGHTDDGPCDAPNGPGTHVMERFAGTSSGSGWESVSNAAGEMDGKEAYSPNVDAGEVLSARQFDVCDPDGEERIDSVVLSVRARTQYESGTYALNLRVDGGGVASTVFTGTAARWHEVDLTGDRNWTWDELKSLTASLALNNHPGGARDSDAWVDSFQLRVVYTGDGNEEPPDEEPPDEDEDTGSNLDTADFEEDEELPSGRFGYACSSPGPVQSALLLPLLVLVFTRRAVFILVALAKQTVSVLFEYRGK